MNNKPRHYLVSRCVRCGEPLKKDADECAACHATIVKGKPNGKSGILAGKVELGRGFRWGSGY